MEEGDFEVGSGPSEEVLVHWQDAVRRAVEYIDGHLEVPLKVNEIAKVAGMSQTHFCRVFRWLVKEKVGEYARRRRLERAASALRLTTYPVTQIALEYGFDSPSAFTRSFRNHFSTTPSRFRRNHGHQIATPELDYSPPEAPSIDVSVVELPARCMTYISVVGGGYARMLDAIPKLVGWGKANRQVGETALLVIKSYDDELITPDEKARYDVGIVTDQPVPAKRAMSQGVIPGGLYAQSRFHGTIEEHTEAWNQLVYQWTFHNGYDFNELAGYDFFRVQTGLVRTAVSSFKAVATGDWHYETEMLMPIKPGRVSVLGRSGVN